MNNDKAGKRYWDDSWKRSAVHDVVNPHQTRLNNYVNRRFHECFVKSFAGIETAGKKLLEIGCARSAWLPYFANEFGFEVHGLDYSEVGCRKARQILANADVEGNIVCADFFSPPEAMMETYDVVVSFGVVEHYEDTAKCLNAFSKFLKSKAIVITIIPNMVGLIGFFQKILNRPVYDIHVPLNKNALRKAHELSGLEVLNCNYFLFTNFGVNNLIGTSDRSLEWFLKKSLLALLVRLSMLFWFFEVRLGTIDANAITSPYITCFGRKCPDTKK